MNQHFVYWYYTQGLRSALLLLGNYLRFAAHRFNMGGLLRTFFSPWKRDVAFHTWRGFRPMRSLEAIFQNLLTRVLGMLVRLTMLLMGILVWCVTLALGIVLSLFYLGAPFFIVLGFILLPFMQFFGVMNLLFGMIGLGSAFFGYVMRKREEPLTFDIEKLRKKKYFQRVLGRLGLKKESVGKERFKDTETFLTFLKTFGIERNFYEQVVRLEHAAAEKKDQKSRFWSWENLHTRRPLGKDWHYAYTPHLDRYCLELSRFDPTEYSRAELVGRHDELRVVTAVLARPTQNSVILVGDPGIGKKTFIHYLARLIRENKFGAAYLDEARVLLFDIGQAVSDAANQDLAVDEYLRRLLSEAAYAGNVILAIENVDLYLGNEPSLPNLAPLFSEFLPLPSFRLITTAPTGRYHALAKEDEQALKYFEVIYLRETTPEETLSILIQQFERAEERRVFFTLKGFEAIVAAAGRYDWETPFPERVIDLAQEVFAYWNSTGEEFITGETVNAFITLKTGVPTGVIGADEKEKLLHLEELLHRRVIGQNEAVKQVAEAMRKARTRFGDDKRPLGSFIFFGPSGVGKTETAKAFAESYFGSEDNMIRLDMSEFQTPESIDRLIGSRALGIPGQLVEAVREKPFSILLLDEIEKAYPRALDLFLQILDEGFVTDGYGERVSFRNTIIIATSNAGAPLIKALVREKAPLSAIRQQVLDHIVENNLFRLEFLNRFDDIIFFEPLQQEELRAVTELKLKKFADRLKKEKNIAIAFAPDVVSKIIEKGFEPEFGARSLNRFIENAIEDVVVKKIIAGEVAGGGSLAVSGDDL
ncbi:MAG: AAA family ATPase [bacterium]|nr:AAA family ATPase [bacterium]